MNINDVFNKIILIASVASACLVLFKIARKPIINIKEWFDKIPTQISNIDKKLDDNKKEQDERFQRMESKIDKIQEVQKEHTIDILGLTMCSEGTPISERIIAGDKYVGMGANGARKIEHKVRKEEYERQLESRKDKKIL